MIIFVKNTLETKGSWFRVQFASDEYLYKVMKITLFSEILSGAAFTYTFNKQTKKLCEEFEPC